MSTGERGPRSAPGGSGAPGSGSGGRSSAAKKRIAEQRAAQAAARKAKERRRRVVVVVSVTVVVALIAAGALAIAGLTGGSAPASSSQAQGVPAQVLKDVTNVPESVSDAVGAGSADAAPKRISGSSLSSGGKPEVLYVGAEYCPYCAAERWAMVVALSRFGSFSGLGVTQSSSTDVYPSTQTLSFHGSTYTSRYLSFVGKEVADDEGNPLDKLSSSQQRLFDTYDAPPYIPSGATKGAIPFVDLGGQYLVSGAQYDAQVLQGKSREQIASSLSVASSPISKSVNGAANLLTAALCKTTKGAPSRVCTAPGIVSASAALG